MKYQTIDDAATWASRFTKKKVTPSNICYLIQYGKIKKYSKSGIIMVSLDELREYYTQHFNKLQQKYMEKLGDGINWHLSFHNIKEKETTKHVHKLHPYKGKFIPQLVEYFLDQHTDDFKKEVFFHPGDIILDPFCGSGTTLVQANELGMHSIGIDLSVFNCLLSETKLAEYNLKRVTKWAKRLEQAIEEESYRSRITELETLLNRALSAWNKKHFSSPDYSYKLSEGLLDEATYIPEVLTQLRVQYRNLLQEYRCSVYGEVTKSKFLNTWFAQNVLKEALAAKRIIKGIDSKEEKDLFTLLLSRTLRSCRTTPHYELERLNNPVAEPYYCYKHAKICRPLLSMQKIFRRYAKDTIKRLHDFSKLRTNSYYAVLSGDSRRIDIFSEINSSNPSLYQLLVDKKIQGIFTSPPYLGQLNYHEQHKYAYDFFGFESHEDKEIGIASRGKGKQAKKDYIKGISDVLINCSKFLAEDSNIFIVANDSYDLYQAIADRSNLSIVQEFQRPVLNRSSRDRKAYGESIFHMRKK